MDEDYGPLASAAATTRNVVVGLEVSQLREYVEDLERKQLKMSQAVELAKAENDLRAKDQADVYYYLNKKLDDNYDVIHSLEEQILREQSEREISEKEYEQLIEQTNSKVAADESKYKSKIFELEDKLDQVREFIGKKEELLEKVKDLNDTLDKEREEFRKRYEDLDKIRIQEKAQLRHDFNMDVEAMARRHKADIDSKLSDKAKKSKILNTMYKKELKYQTLQAEEVLVHDKEVMSRDRARRTEMELSKGMEEELQKKLVEYQRTIRSLNQRIAEDSGKIQDTSIQDQLTKQYEDKCAEYDKLFAEFEAHKIDAKADRERNGKIWKVLMEHYYDHQKRGVRRPLNKIEIESNPEKFVVELLFGVFEANPGRFRKAIKKQMGGGTSVQRGGSFFGEEGAEDPPEDVASLLHDEQKWWSTQNNAYVTSSSNADFAVVNNSSRMNESEFSLPNSTRTTRGAFSTSKSADGSKPVGLKNASVQTDEQCFVKIAVAERVLDDRIGGDSVSLASSNFVIDSYSVPNLKHSSSGVLSSNGGSLFLDNFAGASVDRGVGGNMLRRHASNSRSYNSDNFMRKKKMHKKLILPRLNYLATPPDPETDFSLTGQPISSISINIRTSSNDKK